MKKIYVAIAAVQQAIAMFAGLTMVPILIVRGMGGTDIMGANFVSISMLICGITTLLQCLHWGYFGSGYQIMMGSSSMFIVPSILAGKMGGPAMICGMTLLLSPVEFVMAFFTRYLKHLISPVIAGVLVVLLAFSVMPISAREFAGGFGADFGQWHHWCLGAITVFGTVLAQRTPWKWLNTGSLVVGLICGYVSAYFMNIIPMEPISAAPWVGLPKIGWQGNLDFSWSLVLPFALAYFFTGIETYGDIHAIAFVNNPKMEKVEPKRLTGGLVADATGSLLSGLCGGVANTSFSGNIAIAEMNGVTTSKVGYWVAAIFVLLSATPKFSAVLAVMPAAVLGGSMMVATVVLLKIGLQMMFRGIKEQGELLAAAVGIATGLATQLLGEKTAAFPVWIAPFFSSGVFTGTLAAVTARFLAHKKA